MKVFFTKYSEFLACRSTPVSFSENWIVLPRPHSSLFLQNKMVLLRTPESFLYKIFDGFAQDPRLVGSAGLCWGSGNSHCKATRLYRGKHFCRHCTGYRARICKPFKASRNRIPAWRNRFLGSLNVYKYGLWATYWLPGFGRSKW